MKLHFKRYDWYTILTFAVIVLASFFLRKSWLCVPLIIVLGAQYEIVYVNVAVILEQYKLYRKGKITEIRLTKFQLWLKNVFDF